MLQRLRSHVSIGIKVVTKLRNHVQFIIHSIHRRYPGVRVLVADDEYVGVGGTPNKPMPSNLFLNIILGISALAVLCKLGGVFG